jgi:hypothetical protein
MSNDKLRRQITCEAARLMVIRQESEYYRAKLQAARRIGLGWIKPADMPTNREIRDEIQSLSRIQEGSRYSSGLGERHVDRFDVYQMLLLPLETVKQDPQSHPEGDALYHSLQVYVLARDAQAYDEEFQLAALLHDVGKALDPRDHVAAALEALDGQITQRTAWLIEHHLEARGLRDGTLGARARRRLEAHEDFDDLVLLRDCDLGGRQQGVHVPDLQEALDCLRELARTGGWR